MNSVAHVGLVVGAAVDAGADDGVDFDADCGGSRMSVILHNVGRRLQQLHRDPPQPHAGGACGCKRDGD